MAQMARSKRGSSYARGTPVEQSKSLGEIKKNLIKSGATGFGYLEEDGCAFIAFKIVDQIGEIHFRFKLPLPDREDFRYAAVNQYGYQRKRSDSAIDGAWQQAVNEKWRSLALSIKAKLVGIDDKLETFEQAFFAHIVVPGDGHTMHEVMYPQLQQAIESGGDGQPLMLMPPRSERE